jgi:serine/threonine protein kinase
VRCLHRSFLHGEKIAVKEMVLNEKNERLLLAETRLMAGMKCPEIITFHSAHCVGQQLWILMELMDGGSLANIIDCEIE